MNQAPSAVGLLPLVCPIQSQPILFPADHSRDFIADQAHQFLRLELDNGATTPSLRDNRLLARCVSQLMAICYCTQRTAETHAAQAIAELASERCSVRLDIDRSTAYCLVMTDSATGHTRAVSAAEIQQILANHNFAEHARAA